MVGAVVGSALASRSSEASSGYEGGYCPGRGSHEGGCGVRSRPVFDEYGNRAGLQRVSTC